MNICLRLVSFKVKVWVTYIVILSHGIFRSQIEDNPLIFVPDRLCWNQTRYLCALPLNKCMRVCV